MPRISLVRTVLLSSVALVLAACSPGQPSARPSASTAESPAIIDTLEVPTFTADACRFDVPPGRLVRCGWLEVPADRDDPTKGEVRIHVAVFESPSSDPAPDPVVFLQGGPGGYALETVPQMFETGFGHLLAGRDVILYDQRGVGYSEPSLGCPEIDELLSVIGDADLPDEEATRMEMEAIEACHDRLVGSGVDPAVYTSAASASDLADLREALGIEEWNLYGISYGTRLALTAMRDHPQGIRSVILDSAYPPDVDLIADTPASLDRSLRLLFNACAADSDCASAFPDVEAQFYALLQELEQNPVRAPVLDVATGEVFEPVFDGTMFGGVVFGALYHAQIIPELPRVISETAAGDTSLLSKLATLVWAGRRFVSMGMQFSVQCNEEVPFTSRESLDAVLDEHPELAVIFSGSANLGSGVFDVCDLWSAHAPSAEENEAVASEIPTLVLAGEYDPVTPPSWGERTAVTLDAATFLEIPGAGHGPSATLECPQAVVRDFLDAPGSLLHAECVADMGPPKFATPADFAVVVDLEPFVHEMQGVRLSGLAPAAWHWQGSGTWTRSASALDQTSIIQQPTPGLSPAEVIPSAITRFGLDSEPAGVYATDMGDWILYEGSRMAESVTVAFLEVDSGTLLVAMYAAPSEADLLRAEVLFPVLDALVGS